MVLHDYKCWECGFVKEDVWVKEPIGHVELCTCCGGRMMWQPGGRCRPFPSFTTPHVRDENGQPITFTSLQQIRNFEKKNEARKLCWEAGSYDAKQGDL